jgi:hypothetical protein
MENKKERAKKLLKDFEEKCKKLGAYYLIAVGSEIKIEAHPMYISNVIWGVLAGIPSEARESVLELLLQKAEEE